jgi:hypothetical protein
VKARAIMKAKDEVICVAEIEGGTLKSAVNAVMRRLLNEADYMPIDREWTSVEVQVNRV